MSKTIEEIKDEVATEYDWRNWEVCYNSDGVTNVIINEIAERYAQSQTQELQDQNAELVDMLTMVIDVWGYEYEGSTAYKKVDELLTKHNHLNKKP